jgi:hypothetical protein
MTLAEKNAVVRFKTYLLIARGDVDKTLAIQEKFAPKDMAHEALLRKILKATK